MTGKMVNYITKNQATFTRTKIYCPVNHDMKWVYPKIIDEQANIIRYKEEIDGNETAIDALFCDKKLGQWKLNITANESKIANVYCICKNLPIFSRS